MKKKQQSYNRLHKEILKLCSDLKLKLHNFAKGCKLFDNHQRVGILILYIRSNKSLRTFCDEFTETKWDTWLKLKKFPKKSTLHDWLKLFKTDIIRLLIRYSLVDSNPELVAIDGSGVDVQYKSSYYKKRTKAKSSWHKLDIICSTKGPKQIIDFSFLLKNQHDCPVAEKLFKRSGLKETVFVGDKGYFCFDLITVLEDKDNHFIFPPKDFGGKVRHNAFKHLKIKRNYFRYIDLYRKRNNVESVFSSLKRVQGLRIRSKLSYMKKREMAWNILWYNIRKKICELIFLFRDYDSCLKICFLGFRKPQKA